MQPLDETTKMGQRGAVIIPANLRKLFSLDAGSVLIATATQEGILLRPAEVVPISNPTQSLQQVERSV